MIDSPLMHWILQYQFVLFDFDGLLVDTEPLHYLAYKELLLRQGYCLEWDFERFCKEAHAAKEASSLWDAFEREFPEVYQRGKTRKELYAEKQAIYVDLLQSFPLQLMPGVAPLLETLAAHAIQRAVVTNSPRGHIEIAQKKIPALFSIPHWITREDYSAPKPAPDGYLTAIERFARPGDRIVGFEDTLKGIKALLAAGVEAVLICPPFHHQVAEALRLGARHLPSLACDQ